MKYFQIPGMYGVVKDYHPRMLPDNKVQDCLNVVFKNGRVASRWGYVSMGGSLPLNGAIMGLAFYERIRSGDSFTVACTTRDVYVYEQTSGLWSLITRNYATGTVTNSGAGNRTVTVTGGTFDNTNWTKTTYQIGFGSTDMDAITTWYDVASVDSASALTLAEDGPAAAGSSYVLRLCFSGDEDNFFSFAYPYLDTATDKILILTNGVDPIQKWTGTGACENLGGSPEIAKYVGYFGAATYEHTFAAWITEAGSPYPQRIDMSDATGPEDWSGVSYELLQTNDEITAIAALGSRLVIYKTNSITVAAPTPEADSTDPFDFEQDKISTVGTPCGRTVCDFGGFHLFLGNDNIYMFNGISVQEIGTEIINTLKAELNSEFYHRVFAFPIREENLYCLAIPTAEETDADGNVTKAAAEYPDKMYVYNYAEKTWTIWKFADNFICQGFIKKQYAPTWAELKTLGTKINGMSMRWSDLIAFANVASMIFGDENGNIYEFKSVYLDDDGTDIDASVTTKDFPINDPKHTFNLNEVNVGYKTQEDGSEIKIRASVGFGEARSTDAAEPWSDWVTFDQGGPRTYQETITNFMEHGIQLRLELQNVTGAHFAVESLMVGYADEEGVERWNNSSD